MTKLAEEDLIEIDNRKVQQRGDTHTISLPKEVVDGLGIQPQDELTVSFDTKREALVYEHDG